MRFTRLGAGTPRVLERESKCEPTMSCREEGHPQTTATKNSTRDTKCSVLPRSRKGADVKLLLPMKTFKQNNQGDGGNHVRLNQELWCDSVVGNLYSTHKGLSQGREGDISACLCTGHLGLKSGPYLPMLGKLKAGTPFWRLPGRRRTWESPAQHSTVCQATALGIRVLVSGPCISLPPPSN